MSITFLLFLILPLIMIAAGISDLISFRIPNIFSAILALAFIPFAISANVSLAEFGIHAGISFTILLVGFFLFSAGWLGAGDAKLLAASSLWFSGLDLLVYLVFVALAGGVLSLAILIMRNQPLPAFILKFQWIKQIYTPAQKGRDVPYAVAMMAGLLWILPDLKIMELAAL